MRYQATNGVRPRRGVAALWTLGLMLVTSALAISLIEIYRQQAVRVEMQNAAEAAAEAAARELVDDGLLVADVNVAGERQDAARGAAVQMAFNNGVFGDPVALDRNDANDCRGEIVLGRLDPSAGAAFQAGDLSAADGPSERLLVNACHVHACRTRSHGASASWRLAKALGLPSANVAAEATAILDRDVIGFRPDGIRPIPLVPIALLSDPKGMNDASWEHLVEQGAGPDEYRFNHARRAVEQGADGLHEMRVRFRDDRPPDNVCVLRLGTADWSGMLEQVRRGVTGPEAAALPNGQIVLGADGRFRAPTFALPPEGGQSDLKALCDALTRLRDRGEARVWPLYRDADVAAGDAVVTDFVAARVVRAEQDDHGFELVVQPCMTTTASAVTDGSRRRPDRPTGNKYVCKIRLVQ